MNLFIAYAINKEVIKFQKCCLILFGFRKEKTGYFDVFFFTLELYLVFDPFT